MRRLLVYIDGQCPMCLELARRLKRLDHDDELKFVDMHDPKWSEMASDRFDKQELYALMRVQMPNGTWRSGYFAWGVVLERLWFWRPLGLLMRFPLAYGIGPAVYKWVADRRLIISRLLGLPEPCDENGSCRIPS